MIFSGGVLLHLFRLPGMVSFTTFLLVFWFFTFPIVQLFRCLLWFALASDLPEEHPRVSLKVLLGMDVIMVHVIPVSTGNVNDNEIWNQA